MEFNLNLKLYILILLAATNCTIQKRTHLSGYYVSWKKQSKHDLKESRSNNQNEEYCITKNIVVSNSNLIELENTQNYILRTKKPNETCGDTIYLSTGAKIICKIIEIGNETIKYKQCDNLDGPIYSTKKTGVSKIIYLNSISEHINSIYQDIKNEKQSNRCDDTLKFKDGKIVFCKITEVNGDFVKYKKCDTLNKAEYYVERKKLKNYFENNFKEQPIPTVNNTNVLYLNNNSPVTKSINEYALMGFLSSTISIIFFLSGLFLNVSALLFLFALFYLLAIILATIGLVQIAKDKKRHSGVGLAITAYLLPIFAVLFGGFLWLITSVW